MKKYREIVKGLPPKTVVVTACNFNPPTKEHELLIKVVKNLAFKNKAHHCIFVSSTKDKNNPLAYTKKKNYLKLFFPKTIFKESNSSLSEIVKSLQNKYKKVIVVSLDKKHIKGVEVVRFEKKSDNKALIKYAKSGDYESFKNCLPTTSREIDGKRLMNDIRIGLDLEPIKEQINLVKDDLREAYFQGKIFNEGDIVESNDIAFKVIKRGSNHLLLQDEKGEKVSKWIHEVKTTEKTFMVDKNLYESDEIRSDAAKREQEKARNASDMARLSATHAQKREQLAAQHAREKSNMATNIKRKANEGVESQVVDKKSRYNIAKSVMSLKDFRRMVGVEDETQTKETESDLDASNANNPNQVGSMYDRKEDEQLRRMKDEYQTETKIPTHKASEVTSSINPKHDEDWMDADSQPDNNIKKDLKKKKTYKEARFWGRDDMVQKARADDTARGMVKLRKETDGGTHGVTVHHTKAGKYEKQGYTRVEEETTVEEPRWKQTSHKPDDAIKKYGKDNVRIGHLKMRNNSTSVEVRSEEVEQVDELDKHTLNNYITKAAFDNVSKAQDSGRSMSKGEYKKSGKEFDKSLKRADGIAKAAKKLTFKQFTKESIEEGKVELKQALKNVDKDIETLSKIKDPTLPKSPEALHKKLTDAKMPATSNTDTSVGTVNVGEEYAEFTEKDILQLEADMDSWTDEEMFEELYADDECFVLDEDTGEAYEIEPDDKNLMEIMSRRERVIARARLRRSAPKRQRNRRVALRKISTPAQANSRARRMAIASIKKKLLGGRNPYKVSVGEKERVERFIKQRREIINRLSTRMVGRVKKVERSRFHKTRKFNRPNNGRQF